MAKKPPKETPQAPPGVTGFQILGFLDGGSANKGQDVQIKLRLSNGEKEFDSGFFIQHDQLPVVLSALMTFGGMARNTRMQKNPFEEADGTFAGAHALPLSKCFSGRSTTEPGITILTLQFGDPHGRLLNFYCAANRQQLEQLSSVCVQAIQNLEGGGPTLSTH